jgi:hypothetical protein
VITGPMTPWAFAKCLVDAGLLAQEEVNRTSRIVIDCSMDAPVTIYIQRYGDADALAKLAPMLNGMVRAGNETAQVEPREGTAP